MRCECCGKNEFIYGEWPNRKARGRLYPVIEESEDGNYKRILVCGDCYG